MTTQAGSILFWICTFLAVGFAGGFATAAAIARTIIRRKTLSSMKTKDDCGENA